MFNPKIIWSHLEDESKKTNCKKRQVACIIYDIDKDEVAGIGHNHHPDNICDCHTTKTALHAEQMAVKNMWGERSRDNLIAFVTRNPCKNCADVLNAFVKEVRYRN